MNTLNRFRSLKDIMKSPMTVSGMNTTYYVLDEYNNAALTSEDVVEVRKYCYFEPIGKIPSHLKGAARIQAAKGLINKFIGEH